MNIFSIFEDKLKQLIKNADIKTKDGAPLDLTRIIIEKPRDASHGDLATNAAMVLSQSTGKNPRQLAEEICQLFSNEESIESINVAGPGFINFFLKKDYWHKVLKSIYDNGENYGRSNLGQGRKVNVEYVSANPTGPMHIGHCRGAVVGDVLANLLSFTQHDVTKEYYINDAGGQIEVLARSVFLRYKEALGEEIGTIPEGLYPGEYLVAVGQTLAKDFGASFLNNPEEALTFIKKYSVNAMMALIKDDLAALGVHHDLFFSENSLHENGQKAIKNAVEALKEKGYIYKGILPPPKGQPSDDWEDREQILFRSSSMGDDQDRALVKSDGSYTYFAADIAYFYNKYQRGFSETIYVLGADHSGYVKRLEAAAKAISGTDTNLSVILCQLVKLYRGKEPVKMSKRAGSFITLREVVNEVGADPIRFMMLFRKADAPLDFDFAKVQEQSKENPLFYVQYACARCHSVLRQADELFGNDYLKCQDLSLTFEKLTDPSELVLVKKLADYAKLIEQAVLHREPHRLAFYLYELASLFHAQWAKGNENVNLRFIQAQDPDLTLARLGLVDAIRSVLISGLNIIGVDAPQDMH